MAVSHKLLQYPINFALFNSLDLENRTAIHFLHANDDIPTANFINVIRKSANTVNDGVRVSIPLELNTGGFHNSFIDYILYIDRYCHGSFLVLGVCVFFIITLIYLYVNSVDNFFRRQFRHAFVDIIEADKLTYCFE